MDLSFFSSIASVRIVVLISIDLHRKELIIHYHRNTFICTMLRRIAYLGSQLHSNAKYYSINKSKNIRKLLKYIEQTIQYGIIANRSQAHDQANALLLKENSQLTIFRITSTAPFPSPSAPSISSITYTC